MRRTVALRAAGLLLACAALAARAEDSPSRDREFASRALDSPPPSQDFEFFASEAQVVSASHEPRPLSLAPATVYVLTADDLRASGAQTLWDALRAVPGVDVVTSRTFQGEVGIRGLNRILNNRTLVLLDGRTILNGFGDFVTWESIPVTMEEIDRIEVVEGAVSALHGANAVNGVVNIITKSPQDLPHGLLRWESGQRSTRLGAVLLADHGPRADGKLAVGWRTGNQFTDATRLASEVVTLHGGLGLRPGRGLELRAGGGFANLNTQLTTGATGTAFDDGPAGFVRFDAEHHGTRLCTFWNQGRSRFRDFSALQEPESNYDTWDATLEQSLDLPRRNRLVLGGGYRRNRMRSQAFMPRTVSQDLGSIFFEDSWEPTTRLGFVASGRLDHHPLAGWVLSPRGSAILHLGSRHTFRLSSGSSFRNPTLLENYVQVTQEQPNPGGGLPNPPYDTIRFSVLGNHDLEPERLALYEVAYHGQTRRLRTTLTGYHYYLQHLVTTTESQDPSQPPVFETISSFVNDGHVSALGGECEADVVLGRGVSSFANYSYQSLSDATGYPRHKVNAGLRLARRGLTANLWAHWVDRTTWAKTAGTGALESDLPAYLLLNGHAGVDLGGPLHGFTFGVSAFNLTNEAHAQTLPAQPDGTPGQNGEILRARWLVGITYRMR